MRLRELLASRVGAAAFSAAVAGCVSPADPYGANRSLAGSTDIQQLRVSTEVARSKNSVAPGQPTGVVQASAVGTAFPAPKTFAPEDAVLFALQNNPTLQSVRLQRGFAEGGLVIARTYPFNPIAEMYEQGVMGPSSSGITNKAFTQATVRLDLELLGQGKHRRSAAEAVVTRTEWEIAAQELQVAVAATRAFNFVLYRKRKLDVLEDTIKLNELVAGEVKKLVDLGRLRPADLLLTRTELDAARAQLGQGKVALALARADLRRQLGSLDDSFAVKGDLDVPLPTADMEEHVKVALQNRPDLQARRSAVVEAEARLRLQVADRYGNISFGPSYQYDDTSASYVGVALFVPIPVLNTRRGEIMQAQNAVARSVADVKLIEVQAEQDVQAALIRLAEARKWVNSYTSEVLPNLRKANQDMNKLLEQNDPGVDVVKVIDVQRNYLRAFDAYLDALYELSQGRADLAAAVGDPALAIGMYAPQQPAPKNPQLPPNKN